MSRLADSSVADLDQYLQLHAKKTLLRFLTCGSVDDGKSTLIGRLLYDTKAILADQLAAIQRSSQRWRQRDVHVGHAYSFDQMPSCTPKSGIRNADSPECSLRAACGRIDPPSMWL